MTEEITLSKNIRVCECGCGEDVKGFTHTKPPKPVRYKVGHSRRGKRSGNWKGGRRILDGYIRIYKPDHPRADYHGYIAEHRLVMEQHIGRLVSIDEDVHHINGNKQDNRIENLQLITHGEHTSHHNQSNKYGANNKIDMSNRKCVDCNGRETWTRHWFKTGLDSNGIQLYRCSYCNDRYRRGK